MTEPGEPLVSSLPSTIRSDKMRCGIGVNFKRLPSGCYEVSVFCSRCFDVDVTVVYRLSVWCREARGRRVVWFL